MDNSPIRSHLPDTDSCEDEDDDSVALLKNSRKKKSKKAERTPLLPTLGEASDSPSRVGEESGSRTQRAGTETSDDDTVRFYNDQYGSTSGADFAAVLVEAHRSINHGIFPERIPQGSSGSYFVKNLRGVCFVFVFL